MSAGVRWVADRRADTQRRSRGWLGRLIRDVATLGLGVILVVGIALALRGTPPTGPQTLLGLTAGAQDATPEQLTTVAADALDDAVTSGTGFTFEIVQHSTIVARPGGPLVEIPDPIDRTKTLGEAPTYALGTYLERGFVTKAGFFAEIRRGPDDPTAPPEWDKAPLELAALVRDGVTYRTDGQGWYATSTPPGIGLDPATAALLPTMLRGLAEATDATAPDPGRALDPGRAVADPFAGLDPARRLDGEAKVADIPGIIAVDLAEATELRGPAELAFDGAGRLVGLRILARNTHLDVHDLLVETIITVGYPATAPELPTAEPRWTPPAPAADGK